MSFLTEYFDEYRLHPIRKTKMCRPENRWAALEGLWLDPKVGTQDVSSLFWLDKRFKEVPLKRVVVPVVHPYWRLDGKRFPAMVAQRRPFVTPEGWTGRRQTLKEWTDAEIEQFIKATMKRLRGQSTYFNDYCAHLDQKFKYRQLKSRVKKLKPCSDIIDKNVAEQEASVTDIPKLAIKDTELMKVAEELYEQDLGKSTLKPLPTHFRVLGYVRPYNWHTGLSDYQSGIARLAYEMIRDDRIPRFQAHNGCRPRWGLPPEEQRQPELDGAPFDGERLY